MFIKYNNYYEPFTSSYSPYYMHCPYFSPIMPMQWRSSTMPIPLNKCNPCRKCSSCFQPKFNIKMKKVSIDEIED